MFFMSSKQRMVDELVKSRLEEYLATSFSEAYEACHLIPGVPVR